MITTTQFQILTEPGLANIWHDAWPPRELEYVRVFNIRDMPKLTVKDAKLADFGPLQVQDEGAPLTYDDPLSSLTKEYTKVNKALGYKVTDDMIRAELYGELQRYERGLMKSALFDQENSAWDIINSGFGTTNTGFDGLALFSTAHTRMDGGTNQSNRHASDVALSLAGLHDAIVQFSKYKNERGHPIMLAPKLLIVPPDLQMTAFELLDSEKKPGSADNDVNVIRRFGIDVMVVHYLTSTTAWFIIGDEHDLNFLWWFRPETGSEAEFDTDTIKRKVRQAHAQGFGEWLGTWGSNAS